MHLRITKYSPEYRDEQGGYLRNEWTSATDIGRTFVDGVLTLEEYLTVENAYVNAVKAIMNQLHLDKATIRGLEIYGDLDALSPVLRCDKTSLRLDSIYDGMIVSGQALEDVVRLCLREIIWCRLEGEKEFYVHFGYEYYMYAGYSDDIRLDQVSEPGIYVEEYESPYMEVDDSDD
jgi:hypothetical protein